MDEENGLDNTPQLKLHCNCRFYEHYNMCCSHIMTVLSAHQVKDVENISPSNERWTKRYQWEKYAEVDKTIMPLDPIAAKKIKEIDEAPIDLMNNLDATLEQQKRFEDEHTEIDFNGVSKTQKEINEWQMNFSRNEKKDQQDGDEPKKSELAFETQEPEDR